MKKEDINFWHYMVGFFCHNCPHFQYANNPSFICPSNCEHNGSPECAQLASSNEHCNHPNNPYNILLEDLVMEAL